MRLIDADALDAAFTDLRFSADGTLAHWGDRPDWCLHGSEVEKLIENAPTVGGWTSIKDGPPPEYSDCIVFADGYSQPAQYMKDGKFFTPDNYEAEEIKGVTHWMPYPEGPQC